MHSNKRKVLDVQPKPFVKSEWSQNTCMYIDSDESIVASAQAALVEEDHSCNSLPLFLPGLVNCDETNVLFQKTCLQWLHRIAKMSFLLRKVQDVIEVDSKSLGLWVIFNLKLSIISALHVYNIAFLSFEQWVCGAFFFNSTRPLASPPRVGNAWIAN